ncbi:DNA (cytosine-5)-methyltransferase 1 [Thermomonospora echinospora]|uniref:Cytosine-specific methyltransferase n=2 Tax=Thermomonospora echinospora TaxID=1992 RepID=A0A1H6E058_9ACTN|nr:DNA (cytosine-5)-methyltransferase 1 [Thermomonospora echinospora]
MKGAVPTMAHHPLSVPPQSGTGPRIGSLCSGYGGLDLAAAAVLGGHPVWVADPDPGAAATLAHHWPDVANLGDITATDFTTVPAVEVLCAGFPCQDISNAGPRAGIEGSRSSVWRDVARAVRDLRPGYVVLENVAALLARGMGTVLADLAALGYDAAWTCLRASDVGAPHRRERVFILARPAVADAPHDRHQRPRRARDGRPGPAHGGGVAAHPGVPGPQGTGRPAQRHSATAERGVGVAAHPQGERRDQGRPEPTGVVGGLDAAVCGGASVEWGRYAPAIARWERVCGRPTPDPTEPAPRGGRRLSPLFAEWLMGLPAGWVTAVPGLTRNQQLRLLGNGVVPAQGVAALTVLLTEANDLTGVAA